MRAAEPETYALSEPQYTASGRTTDTLRSPAGKVSLMLVYFSFTNSAYAVPGRLTLGTLGAFRGFPSSCARAGR